MFGFQQGVKGVVFLMASLVYCGFVAAADGWWVVGDGAVKLWDDTTYWKGGVVAEGEDSTAYLRSATTSEAHLKVNRDVSLHAIYISSLPTVFHLQKDGAASLKLKNNPVVFSEPVLDRRSLTRFYGKNLLTGDADSVLTLRGNTYDFASVSVGEYVVSGFSRVDVKNVLSFAPRSVGGMVDGDVRLINTRFNNNAASTTEYAPISGKLIIGPGMSSLRIGYEAPVCLPDVIAREKAGLIAGMDDNTGKIANFKLPGASKLLNAEGRLPTWFLHRKSGVYYFTKYDDENGLSIFDPNKTDFTTSTSADTLNVSENTTLGASATVGAVEVSAALDVADTKLTLGSSTEPGLLLMNKDVNGGDGQIEFVGDEGIVVVNGDVHLRPQVVGDSSLTVVAGFDESESRFLYLDNVNNSFTGGVDLVVGVVVVTNSGALGPGPVRVQGYPGSFDGVGSGSIIGGGGTLYLEKPLTLTNDLSLAGTGEGGFDNKNGKMQFSALRLGNGTKVESRITLDDGTCIRSDRGRAELAGPVGGSYKLNLWPFTDSTLLVSGEITTGKDIDITTPQTMEHLLGTVCLGASGSFGTGRVRNDGTLVFDGARRLDNVLYGHGTFLQTNDVTTTFAQGIEQGRVYVGKGTVALEAATNHVGALTGTGIVEVTSSDAVLAVGSDAVDCDGMFCGTIKTPVNGKLTLVKEGTNTQIFAGSLSFAGETIVKAGVLKLGGVGDGLPRTFAKPQFFLDATDMDTLTTNAQGLVSAWASKGSTADVVFSQDNETIMPTYDAAAMNGRGGVFFDNSISHLKDMTYSEPAVTNRLFSANTQVDAHAMYFSLAVNELRRIGGLIGQKDSDNGIRFGYDEDQSHPNVSYDTGYTDIGNRWHIATEDYSINGVGNCATAPRFVPHILGTKFTTPKTFWHPSIGEYFGNRDSTPRGMNGWIGEMLIYSQTVSAADDFMITRYLLDKWGVEGTGAQENVLPTASALTVERGATVDFAGVSQTLERLDCYGTLCNSSTNPVVLTVKGGVLGGKVEGNIRIVKVGEGNLALDNANVEDMKGRMTIQGGTVSLRTWRSTELPVTDGLAFHLDSSVVESLVSNDDGRLVTWKDLSGNGVDFNEDSAARTTPPRFDATLFNGRGGVLFESTEQTVTNRLSSSKSCVVRSILFFTRTDDFFSCDGIFGPRNEDYGIRLGSNHGWAPYRNGETDSGFGYNTNFFINGVQGTTFTTHEPYVFQVNSNQENYNKQWSLGQYFNWPYGVASRGYIGQIGEVIAFNRFISGEEQRALTDYLTQKWMSEGGASDMAFNADTALELNAGVTLDLGRTTQTFNGLYGSGGTVKNGDVTVSGVLEVTADDDGVVNPYVFDSVAFEDGLRIVIKGTPGTSRFVIAKGVTRANTSTFILPSTVWKATFGNGELSLSRGGTLLLVR